MTVIPLYVSISRFERKLPIKPATPVTRTVLFSNEISAIKKEYHNKKKMYIAGGSAHSRQIFFNSGNRFPNTECLTYKHRNNAGLYIR